MRRIDFVFKVGCSSVSSCKTTEIKEQMRALATHECELCDVVASSGRLLVRDAERLVELTREDEAAAAQLGLAAKLCETSPYHNALSKLAFVRTHSGILGWREVRLQWLDVRQRGFTCGFCVIGKCLPLVSALRRGLQAHLKDGFGSDCLRAEPAPLDVFAISDAQEHGDQELGGLLALTDRRM